MVKKQSHKTVLLDHTVKRFFCDDENCDFYGEIATQGVCFDIIDPETSKYFQQQMDEAEEHLAFNRKHNYKKLSPKQRMKGLENEVVVHYMNYSSCLDELVWLRGEIAKLRAKVKRLSIELEEKENGTGRKDFAM